MERKYVCDLCKKTHTNLDDYLDCVFTCGEYLKQERKEKEQREYREKLYAEINKVKQAKKYYEEQLADFKAKYPKEYELNFATEGGSKDAVTKVMNTDLNDGFNKVSVRVTGNGKDKPVVDAKINGKKVDDDKLASLFDDPETRYFAKLLGIL